MEKMSSLGRHVRMIERMMRRGGGMAALELLAYSERIAEQYGKVCLELSHERMKHARATKHMAKAKTELRQQMNHRFYLMGRVKNLKRELRGMEEIERVNLAYIAMILQACGHTNEETGIELDINEISQSLDKFEVIGVPAGGTRIKMFAREKTE